MLRHVWWVPLALAAAGACGKGAQHARTAVFASGADLRTVNPLVTVHPLAKQVERYVLLTTLARYDASLVPQPYLARAWRWSDDHRALTFALVTDAVWTDGLPTVARDVAWTLNAARDSATGYPRLDDLSAIAFVSDLNDSTVVVRFAVSQAAFPDVLTDLAILPAHLLDSVPHERLRQAGWNEHPVSNGPFRFVQHEPNRRWVFEANRDFPQSLGGPPRLERFVVAVVDEPTTKLAALVSGEVDFAGIQPAHAGFVEGKPHLAVVAYPMLTPYAVVFNKRGPPFDDPKVRRAVSLAVNRQEIVDGYLYGFGAPAFGPVPPDLAAGLGLKATPAFATNVDSAHALLGGRGVKFELLTVGSGEAPLEQMVQAQLARAGFDVAIRQVELSAFLDRVYSPRPDFQAALVGIPGDLGLGYLRTLARITGVRAGADAAATMRVLRDSVPAAFLYYARGVQGMNRRMKGVQMDLRGELPTVVHWWTEQ
ncbi:MAG TPA: ABC transporter substrate-binding protein [Gemmatimonadales bacterium]|nr:ABC transporter substrate-binding protein [Gemmatimonadales bacterium]